MKALFKSFSIFSMTVLLCLDTQAQFLDVIQIGQGSDNSYTKGEPAQFVATYPGETNDSIKNSYQVNGFVSATLFKKGNFSLSGVAEWQKNTLIEKEQEVRQFGVDIQQIFLLKSEPGSLGSTVHMWDLYSNFNFKSNNDLVRDEKGVVASLSFSNDFPVPWENFNILQPNKYFPASNIPTSKYLQIKHTHSLGFDFLSSSSLLMSNLTFGLELYPFSGLLNDIFDRYNILQLKGSVVYRGELTEADPQIDTGVLLNYGIAFNYKFDEDGKTAFAIAYEVTNGSNPMKGLEDQEFAQLSFKVKLKI